MPDRKDFGPPVDYNRSIEKQQLVYVKKQRLDYLLMRFAFIIIIIVCLCGFIADFILSQYVTAGILSLIAAFLSINLYYQNKLVKVKGSGLTRNRQDAIHTLGLFYNGLTFNASNENLIRDVNFGGYFFEPTWDIVVLLEEDNVYFHKSDFGKGHLISPLFGINNYFKCKKIAERFRAMQQKQTLPS